ncbi:MAG: hypothetical protein EOR16_32275 [Mesorhizobium sp.]|uniref:hypothetical protein n=1 Tax=Mesorhizobium sp. TaxID=1871066 RepID=UPI000FE728D6|nr:hypothetical protein [Mesorhizobium sp.]RWI48927.1 MAG: hypothetical protein EOR16_32275 [Mesorhizobium sp.]
MDADNELKLAIVRGLIARIEAIDPNADVKPDQAGLWLDIIEGLQTFDTLKEVGARLKADRELRSALKEFMPFVKLTNSGRKDDFINQVNSEVKEIERSGVVAMEEQVFDLGIDDDPATRISRWKWTLLFVLYALEFAILYGLEGAVWNIIRQLGGVSYKDPKRIGTEMAAAIVVAIQIPEFQRLLRHVLQRAKLAPVITGDVNIIVEHGEMITTGFLCGLSIDAGVHAAIALAGDNPGLVKYWMFLGYFSAFLTAGFINGIGQLCLGRQLVVGPPGQSYPDSAGEALVVFGEHYVGKDVFLYERLFHFFNWGLYNFYGVGFGDGEWALAGSLWLFVALFKVSFFWAGWMQKRFAH